MKSLLFAYYDKQIGAYSGPLTFQGDVESLKTSIIRAIKGKQLKMANMDVLDLYYLGEYEDETGEFAHPAKPTFLLSLCEYLPVSAQPVVKEVEVHEDNKIS